MNQEQTALAKELAASPLFAGLSERHVEMLAVNARVLRHGAGDMIVHEAETARGFHVVLQGRVKVFRMSPEGREQTLYHFGPGEPFCLCALFENRSFLANAAALEPSTVLFIPVENLERMGHDEPALLFNLLFLLARRLKEAMDLVESLSVRTLNERVALFLLKLLPGEDAQGRALAVQLPMTHRELAKVVGVSHEALSRAFRALTESGLLEVSGREVVILDPEGLASLAGPQRGA